VLISVWSKGFGIFRCKEKLDRGRGEKKKKRRVSRAFSKKKSKKGKGRARRLFSPAGKVPNVFPNLSSTASRRRTGPTTPYEQREGERYGKTISLIWGKYWKGAFRTSRREKETFDNGQGGEKKGGEKGEGGFSHTRGKQTRAIRHFERMKEGGSLVDSREKRGGGGGQSTD